MAVDILSSFDLVSLGRVKEWLGKTAQSGDHDALLQRLIHAVSGWVHSFCGRDSFLSQTYTHDGTTMRRLPGSGTEVLVLPNAPVTTITTLKRAPDESALTRGWDKDYVCDPWDGSVVLLDGAVFEDMDESVEITYTAGYFGSGASAAQRLEFGLEEHAADLLQSVVDQIEAMWKMRGQQTLVSVAGESGTFAFQPDLLLPHVRAAWKRYSRAAMS